MSVKRVHAGEIDEEAVEKVSTSKLKRHRFSTEEEMSRPQFMDALPYLMDPFLREVVREEVEKTISCYVNSVPRSQQFNQIHGPECRRWRLRFTKKLPGTLFAGSNIEADDNMPMRIVLVDSFTNAVVTSGNLSSIKVEILVLNGEFGGEEERHDWTEQEFLNSLVKEREGKRPLLTGDLLVGLSQGSGCFGDIIFTDNSSWIRSRKFRLGGRVQNGTGEAVGVREAVSGAFVVKDHRGELYKKHHPPSLCDEVWRLEKIGKGGVSHKRLAENGINSVQDFLKLLVVNQDNLRSMLGGGVSNKNWDVIVQHAWECSVDNTPCSCYDVKQQVQLYFNSILQIVGVRFFGCSYQPFSELGHENQALVNRLKEIAYRNPDNMVDISIFPTKPTQLLLTGDASLHTHSNGLDFPNLIVPVVKQDELMRQEASKQFPNPTDGFIGDQCKLKENTTIQELFPSERSVSLPDNFSSIKDLYGRLIQDYELEPSTSGYGEVTFDSLNSTTTDCFTSKKPLHYSPDFCLGDGLFNDPGSEISVYHPPTIVGLNSRGSSSKWMKLLATLKCGMLIRKRLAAKRRAKTQHISHEMYSCFQDSFFY